MKLSDFIDNLEWFLKDYGDVEVALVDEEFHDIYREPVIVRDKIKNRIILYPYGAMYDNEYLSDPELPF